MFRLRTRLAPAVQCGAAGFVSLEGSGRPAADIIRRQLTGKLPPELAVQSDQILRDLEGGKTTPSVPPALAALYRPSVQPYMISWFRYDPAKVIAGLRMPLLVVGAPPTSRSASMMGSAWRPRIPRRSC